MLIDVCTLPWKGVAIHGNTPFDCMLVTPIDERTYLGGCLDGLHLPNDVKFVVSLYPWESYRPGDSYAEGQTFKWLDAGMPDLDELKLAAEQVNEYRSRGVTLVHCQAGLNRSGLVLAYAFVLGGAKPREAIAHLREKRSPAVLCNPEFEAWLLGLEAAPRTCGRDVCPPTNDCRICQ